MSLTFTKNLTDSIPDYILKGMNRIEHIRKFVDSETHCKKEIYLHLKKLLLRMIRLEASDIDLGGLRANRQVWFRVFGEKKPDTEMPSYTEEEVTAMALCILTEHQKELLFQNKSIDFALSMPLDETKREFRFRGNIYFERDYLAINLRIIKQELFKITELEIPKMIVKRLDLEYEKSGLFLITGITGSGKSSTLDSIIDMNNAKNNAEIIIIGNPIEYIHQSKKCIISHREIGSDVLSFRHGTIEALRQDPDIIIVGEMRDAPTISTVLEVTDSGHKVFTTLHTSSAADSIHRIIAEFPPDEQERVRFRLADVLRVVVSQKLVPNKRGKLTLAKEILSVDSSIQAAIRNGNITEIFQMLTEGKNKGMFTMQQDLYRLYRKGIITADTALNYCNNKKVMLNLLRYSS